VLNAKTTPTIRDEIFKIRTNPPFLLFCSTPERAHSQPHYCIHPQHRVCITFATLIEVLATKLGIQYLGIENHPRNKIIRKTTNPVLKRQPKTRNTFNPEIHENS
jgi:hypothetical protein